MKVDSLERRLADLEKQCEEPPKIRFGWYDDDPEPLDSNVVHIQIRWFDEVTDETKYVSSGF